MERRRPLSERGMGHFSDHRPPHCGSIVLERATVTFKDVGKHSDLGRFAQEFRDEAHLRLVLRDLLTRSGAKGVRITHGANEHGKDIIFYKEGGLSKDVLYACVVKKDKITGRADSRGGAQTVLNQALQALNEPYTEPVTGRETKVHSVYVICPNECTPEAVESIKKQLRDQARRIEFICGIDLLTLFQDNWPDFLRFESAVLTRYLSTLSAGLSVDNALISLLTRHNANLGLKPFESFYVANQLEFRLDALEAPQTPLPWAGALNQHLTWAEVQETASRLRFWRQALRSSELTGEDPSTLKELNDFIEQFGRGAKKYWEQAVKTRRLRKSHLKRDVPSLSGVRKVRDVNDENADPEERQLDVPPKLQVLYSRCFSVLDRVNQQLIEIQKASTNAWKSALKMQGGISNLISDDDFCFLSVSYDFLNVVPGLLKQKARESLTADPESLFSICRAILISGPPGSGKTSFCRWQTLRAIEKFSVDWSQPLPIYVPAHRLTSSKPASFEDLFLGGVDLLELWPHEGQRHNVPIRLFVDGLDELPDREQQHRIVDIVKEGLQKYPRLVVIVTSRPYVWGSWLNWLPRVHMAELTPREQRALTSRWLEDSNQVSAFFSQLESSPALRRLMGVPLLATLILNLYRKTPAIPENKASLYRAFVDLYSGGWDVAKGIHKAGQFGNEQKLRPLPGMAYRMHLSHRADCTESFFVRAVTDTMPALVPQASDLLAEIIQDGILVRVGQDLVFAHLSFQEYLAAQYLASDPMGNRPAHALRSLLRGEDWWKEVVEFYLIGRDDPVTLDDWIDRISGGAGRRPREDLRATGNDVFGRLDALANVLAETFTGYSPRFNKVVEGRTERNRKLPNVL